MNKARSCFWRYLPAVVTLPCVGDKVTIGDCISQIYSWSLAIVGIVAFVQIVIAGWMYLTAAGNAATTAKARSKISNAILGIVLLFASYIILRTINPDFVKGGFSLPKINVKEQPVTTIGASEIKNFKVTSTSFSTVVSRASGELLTFTFVIYSSEGYISQECGTNSDLVSFQVEEISPEIVSNYIVFGFKKGEFGASGKDVTKNLNTGLSSRIPPPFTMEFVGSFYCYTGTSWVRLNRSTPASIEVIP